MILFGMICVLAFRSLVGIGTEGFLMIRYGYEFGCGSDLEFVAISWEYELGYLMNEGGI